MVEHCSSTMQSSNEAALWLYPFVDHYARSRPHRSCEFKIPHQNTLYPGIDSRGVGKAQKDNRQHAKWMNKP